MVAPRPWTAIALFAALIGPPLFVIVPERLFGPTPSLSISIVLQTLYCGLAVFVLWVIVSRERLPLSSVGLHRPIWPTLAFGLLFWAAGMFVLPVLTGPLAVAVGREGLAYGIHKLAVLPIWFRLVMAVTGGAIEELCYRGYAIERFTVITGRRWLAATIAITAFALAHIPNWGSGVALVGDLPFGMLMTAFYLWRRDLLANALAHSTNLVVSMITSVP